MSQIFTYRHAAIYSLLSVILILLLVFGLFKYGQNKVLKEAQKDDPFGKYLKCELSNISMNNFSELFETGDIIIFHYDVSLPKWNAVTSVSYYTWSPINGVIWCGVGHVFN
jgi:hypothetical protein